MRLRVVAVIAVCASIVPVYLPLAHADVIATNTKNFIGTYNSYYAGQSFTVGGAGSYNDIVFNFYQRSTTTPAAFGTAYLLSQAYAGTPAALNAGASGFLGSASGSGGYFNFASSVTLQSGMTYYLYADISAGYSASEIADGNYFYYSTGGAFQEASGSATYTVTGDAVAATSAVTPEPSSVTLLSTGLLGLVGFGRRRWM